MQNKKDNPTEGTKGKRRECTKGKKEKRRVYKRERKIRKTNVRKATSKPGRRKHRISEGIHKVVNSPQFPHNTIAWVWGSEDWGWLW